MEKPKIDFNHIANLNYSNRNQYQSNNDEGYINDKILIFADGDDKTNKIDIKKNNKFEFQRILSQTKQKFKSLSEKTEQIIDSKCFSFKNFLVNKLNNSIIPQIENNNKNIINNNINRNENMDNLNTYNNNIIKKLENNHLILNDKNILQNNIYKQNSGEISDQKLIGKKRMQNKDYEDNNRKKEIEIYSLFNDILNICNEFSILNNEIIKKEEQNYMSNENEKIETTISINNNKIVTIYLNGGIINKVYVFENNKILIKENEILHELEIMKKKMNKLLNKLKKNNLTN